MHEIEEIDMSKVELVKPTTVKGTAPVTDSSILSNFIATEMHKLNFDIQGLVERQREREMRANNWNNWERYLYLGFVGFATFLGVSVILNLW